MAPRRAAQQVEEEEEVAQAGGLQFNQPLSWRAGKPIVTGELLKRLNALADELREMDQEEIDKDSFTTVAKELAGQHLLGHKDKGVRALTGCCLVDVLKLCAPDAPFSGSQLKDIFTFFITSILPALADPSNAYNTQHKYVLASLAEVKSIVLLSDVPTSDSLTIHLFSGFFDIISKSAKLSTDENIAKDVEWNMSQILVTLVDESAQLPSAVVDVIVVQFLRASNLAGKKGKIAEVQDDKQSTLLPKEYPEAYNMAKTICNLCPEKMARYISQYFNEVIMDVSAGVPKSNGHRRKSDANEDEDEETSGPTDMAMDDLEKAHRLLRELWRASPTVLQNVIPQLEAELSAENVDLRLLATQTLGDIISGIGAAGPPPLPVLDAATYPPVKLDQLSAVPISNSILTTPISPQSFATTHPEVYTNFLGRKNDKSPIIRAGWTTAVGRILVTSAGGIGLSQHEESILVKGLAEKLNDADDKVRLAAVKTLESFSFRDIITKLAPNGSVSKAGSVLCSLADRARDRKYHVRQEAMKTLGRIWGVASGEIAAGNDLVIEALGSIPSKILDAYYANDKETNALLDHVVFEQLVPLTYPPSKPKRTKSSSGESQSQINGEGPFDADRIRTERILLVVKSLDPKSLKAFFALQARQPTYSNVLTAFLKRCEDYNGGVSKGNAKEVKVKLDAVIKWLSDLLPNSEKATHDLQRYAKWHDRRSYQLLRFSMAPENDFKTVNNAIKEFTKRVKETSAAGAGLLETFLPIIYRSSSLIYNRSHNPVILSYSRSDEKGLGATAQLIINEISEKHPDIFQTNVKELSKALADQAPTASTENDRGSVDTLKALASFAKTHSKQIPRDRKFVQTLISYALFGTPARAAKHAVSILLEISDRREMHTKDLLEKSTTNAEYGSDHFLSKLATLSQLSLLAPDTVQEANDEILSITTTGILLQNRTIASDDDPEWQEESAQDEEIQAKCWALKILVNRLRTLDDPDAIKQLAVPIYKLLNKLITNNGEISKENLTPLHHRTRLRLLAAQLLLKLCTVTNGTKRQFDDLVSPIEFNRLALIAQDQSAHVRHAFIEKLQKYIVNNKLSTRFLTIIFTTAFEPDTALSSSLNTWIRSRAKLAGKSKTFEATFPRLLHLLAHHPDYSEDPLDLRDNARYILYYLNTVGTEENIALINKYAERLKSARDAIASPAESDRIYLYSDVAQSVIRFWLEKKGWTMQTWPDRVGLPIGLFAPLPSHEVSVEIAAKNYLPGGDEGDIEDLLEELVKSSGKKLKSKKRKVAPTTTTSYPSSPVIKRPRTTATPKSTTNKTRKTANPKRTPKERAQSTPVPDSERRRSGRAVGSAAGKRKSYADRGDSSDDEEMMDGVAEWEYEGGVVVKDVNSEDDEEEEVEEEDVNGSEPEVEEESVPEATSEAEEVVEEEREEIPLKPPYVVSAPPPRPKRINGKLPVTQPPPEPTPKSSKKPPPPTKNSATQAKKAISLPTRTSRTRAASSSASAAVEPEDPPAPSSSSPTPTPAKSTAKGKGKTTPAAQATGKVKPKAKLPIGTPKKGTGSVASTASVGKKKGGATAAAAVKGKGKGKGKEKAKDVFDFESD